MEEKPENKSKSQNNNFKNYLKPLKREGVKMDLKSMRGRDDLHDIIHRLKGHYNDLMKIKNTKSNHLKELKQKNQGLNKQIEDKLAFSDIELPLEKISIRDYDKFKNSGQTKEAIQERIENLIAQKNKLFAKFETESEYGKKINHLMDIEKQNYEDVHKHINELKEKINTIKIAEKNLELNQEEKSKKDKKVVIYN